MMQLVELLCSRDKLTESTPYIYITRVVIIEPTGAVCGHQLLVESRQVQEGQPLLQVSHHPPLLPTVRKVFW